MIEVGMMAPDFVLPNAEGEEVRLSDYRGKKVVLYFYPKDNTPGCTRQACAFAGAYQGFVEKDVVVIGISKDTVASHKKFAEKHNLPFVLLADPEKAKRYRKARNKEKAEACAMCGDYCAVKIVGEYLGKPGGHC